MAGSAGQMSWICFYSITLHILVDGICVQIVAEAVCSRRVSEGEDKSRLSKISSWSHVCATKTHFRMNFRTTDSTELLHLLTRPGVWLICGFVLKSFSRQPSGRPPARLDFQFQTWPDLIWIFVLLPQCRRLVKLGVLLWEVVNYCNFFRWKQIDGQVPGE